MANNVATTLAMDHASMGRAAREHVVANFSWPATFAKLFNEIYPKALAHAAQRSGTRALA